MNRQLVIEGQDNFLFLGGGHHSPLDFITDKNKLERKSIQNFWRNISLRQHLLDRRNIDYTHIIVPDKHAICKEVFPVDIAKSLGDIYLESCSNDTIRGKVVYPKSNLIADFKSHCYRVDTHYRPSGNILMLSDLLKVVKRELVDLFLDEVNTLTYRDQENWEGDLGSKLPVPRSETKVLPLLPASIIRYSNQLQGGNNGIIDLYVNRKYLTPNSPKAGRVLVFGDSCGRELALFLSLINKEVLFLRTPFFHVDIVDLMKPDLVITQNVERYLSWVSLDEERPFFFVYPSIKANTCTMDSSMAQAISAVLSYGRTPYRKFIEHIGNQG